jgi:hypothetical protein
MKNTELDLNADIIDVRDIIARIEELEDAISAYAEKMTDWQDNADNTEELAKLQALLDDLEGLGGDEQWRGNWYPVTLIRDSYFKDYAQELAEDIGAVKSDAQWPHTCIDWDHAARELQYDYTSIEIDDVTYWTR